MIPKKKAISLKYDESMGSAPIVTAKGKGYVAEKIIEMAKENKVPIQEDKSLVEVLSEVEVNEQIPPELYQVVAEILAFVYQLDKEK